MDPGQLELLRLLYQRLRVLRMLISQGGDDPRTVSRDLAHHYVEALAPPGTFALPREIFARSPPSSPSPAILVLADLRHAAARWRSSLQLSVDLAPTARSRPWAFFKLPCCGRLRDQKPPATDERSRVDDSPDSRKPTRTAASCCGERC